MKKNFEIRSDARNILTGNWVNAVLAGLIYSSIISVASSTFGISIFLMGALAFGLYLYFLTLVREDLGDFNLLFKAFSFSGHNLGMFGKTLGLYLIMNLFIFLWTLLLIIPGIIASYSYRMAFYLLIDDPDMNVMDAISRSKEMMKGFKTKLFLLDLSFIGWGLLSVLSFGIGFLWLTPYMITSQSIFYEKLREELGIHLKSEVEKSEKTEKSSSNIDGVVE